MSQAPLCEVAPSELGAHLAPPSDFAAALRKRTMTIRFIREVAHLNVEFRLVPTGVVRVAGRAGVARAVGRVGAAVRAVRRVGVVARATRRAGVNPSTI